MLVTIISALKNCGAADAAAVPVDALTEYMSDAAIARALRDFPRARSLICAIFPYFHDFSPGNISLYARGADYHKALLSRLDFAARGLREIYPQHAFMPLVDASPFPEVRAAALCGLGMIGRNTLLIRPPYGSFVFIGTIASTAEIGGVWLVAPCKMCGKCEQMCPTGAISDAGVDSSRCLSAITQKKGGLNARETEAVRRGAMVWGCDVCQKVCPMNRDLRQTGLAEFSGGLLRSFPARDAALSSREFRQKYGSRALAWRGIQPIRRNIEILGL